MNKLFRVALLFAIVAVLGVPISSLSAPLPDTGQIRCSDPNRAMEGFGWAVGAGGALSAHSDLIHPAFNRKVGAAQVAHAEDFPSPLRRTIGMGIHLKAEFLNLRELPAFPRSCGPNTTYIFTMQDLTLNLNAVKDLASSMAWQGESA